MLSGNYIQALVGSVLAPIYEPGTLEVWATATTRDPASGTFPRAKSAEHPVRVQVDRCTEAMRSSPLYTAQDVRLLVLQYGIPALPDTDCRIIARGVTYRAVSIGQDPARAYWDIHATAAG